MSESFTRESVPALAPTYRFQWEKAQDCWVVLYPEGMVKLSPTAGEIMKHCDGEKSVDVIIAELKAAFGNADLDDDVIHFLNEARNNGWLIDRK